MTKHYRPKVKIPCCVCGSMFDAVRSKAKKGVSTCCSKSCRGRKAASMQSSKGRPKKHGACSGGVLSPLYRRWSSMKARCHSKTCSKYGRYGARGIQVCDEWRNSFASFEEWAVGNGFQENLQLDRIDNSKGYSPSNCRWVSCIQNQANRDRSLIFPSGETTAEVAKRLGMAPNSIRERLKRGMSKEQAMTLNPVPNGFARKTFKITDKQ
jgi:hypothetical protein